MSLVFFNSRYCEIFGKIVLYESDFCCFHISVFYTIFCRVDLVKKTEMYIMKFNKIN
jgi:hypothetical protein